MRRTKSTHFFVIDGVASGGACGLVEEGDVQFYDDAGVDELVCNEVVDGGVVYQ